MGGTHNEVQEGVSGGGNKFQPQPPQELLIKVWGRQQGQQPLSSAQMGLKQLSPTSTCTFCSITGQEGGC